MSNKTSFNVDCGGPLFLLFLTFLVLKLTAVIDWSWWWVTAPLWIPFGILGAAGLIGLFCLLLIFLFHLGGKK